MKIETLALGPRDWVPNNPTLPVLIYRQAVTDAMDVAAAFEQRFHDNGWVDCWRNGIFSYQHYHTQAHEVLGVALGHARLVIGGPGGCEIVLASGDCIVLPAGTGHCRMEASGDFLVIGAYPPNQHADINTQAPSAQDLERMLNVPLPSADPVAGEGGPLMTAWRSGK
ncbi:cupin [Pararhizobium gei]|uniref:cupin n=1 Tax=Pararhizobium gei TaxID=1395951 RepID=UPI0023DC38C4|nr:cupin [Rhizobium gei]